MSKIYNTLSGRIMEALKNKEPKKAQAYKNLKAKLLEWKTSKEGSRIVNRGNGEIPDSAEITVLQKMCAELKGDIGSYVDRQDLIDEATLELSVLTPMLPPEPTAEDIREVVDTWSGSFEKSSMGAIVKYVKEKLPGAPGKLVSCIVREEYIL